MLTWLVVWIAGGAGACRGEDDGEGRVGVEQRSLISDEVHGGGTAGFLWMPPMVPRPAIRGEIVASLQPVVRIDEVDWANPSRVIQTLATYSRSSGTGGETVRVHLTNHPPDDGDDDPAGYFVVRWRTRSFDLQTAKLYRIRVLLDGRQLGFADVDVVGTQREIRNVDRNAFVPLLEDQALRIKFRIEREAIDRCGGVVCAASDQCHVAGTCDPATGLCSNPAKADGIACDDGDLCTRLDSCLAGSCAGASPVVCGASDQCHDAGACDPGTGVCSDPRKADGAPCDDGNFCTQFDSCLGGTCSGASRVVCAATGPCYLAGVCDAATGICSNPPAAPGTPCSDGDACTAEACDGAGSCAATVISCNDADTCTDDGCDPGSGCTHAIDTSRYECRACAADMECAPGVCRGGRCCQGDTVPNGLAHARAITAPGGVTTLTFCGAAGERVSILADGISSTGCAATTVHAPSGAVLFGPSSVCSSASVFMEVAVLPETGLYTVTLDGVGSTIGSYAITVWSVPADERILGIVDGGPVTATIGTPGQKAVVEVVANAGDRVAVFVDPASSASYDFALIAPDGTSVRSRLAAGDTFTDLLVLPLTGTYAIVIDPRGGATLTTNVEVTSVPLDVVVDAAIDGGPVQAVMTADAQNAVVRFQGSVGQAISIVSQGPSAPCADYLLSSPSGAVVWRGLDCGFTFSERLVLTETGEYRLSIDLRGMGAGTHSVTVRSVAPDLLASASVDGAAVPVQIVTPAQNARVELSAASGQRITITIDLQSGTLTSYRLRAPDGSSVWSLSALHAFSQLLVLPSAGIYTLEVDPRDANLGSYSVRVRSVPPDLQLAATQGGPSVPVTITAPAQNAVITFEGTAGDRVAFTVTQPPSTFAAYQLRASDGTVVWSVTNAINRLFSDLLVLPATGTYTLLVDPRDEATGDYVATIGTVAADATSTASIGGGPVTSEITTPAQNATVLFDVPSAGRVLTVVTSRSPSACVRLTLRRPDGVPISGIDNSFVCSTFTRTITAPLAGQYQLFVNPDQTYTGTLTTSVD